VSLDKKFCLTCGVEFMEGLVLDSVVSGSRPAEWVEGTAGRIHFKEADLAGRDRHTLVAWRCPKCGGSNSIPDRSEREGFA